MRLVRRSELMQMEVQHPNVPGLQKATSARLLVLKESQVEGLKHQVVSLQRLMGAGCLLDEEECILDRTDATLEQLQIEGRLQLDLCEDPIWLELRVATGSPEESQRAWLAFSETDTRQELLRVARWVLDMPQAVVTELTAGGDICDREGLEESMRDLVTAAEENDAEIVLTLAAPFGCDVEEILKFGVSRAKEKEPKEKGSHSLMSMHTEDSEVLASESVQSWSVVDLQHARGGC
ncbi:unnamed protein product [Effrenium voratum]|nr:unnamed protein product [Effrenium voratum]